MRLTSGAVIDTRGDASHGDRLHERLVYLLLPERQKPCSSTTVAPRGQPLSRIFSYRRNVDALLEIPFPTSLTRGLNHNSTVREIFHDLLVLLIHSARELLKRTRPKQF